MTIHHRDEKVGSEVSSIRVASVSLKLESIFFMNINIKRDAFKLKWSVKLLFVLLEMNLFYSSHNAKINPIIILILFYYLSSAW